MNKRIPSIDEFIYESEQKLIKAETTDFPDVEGMNDVPSDVQLYKDEKR